MKKLVVFVILIGTLILLGGCKTKVEDSKADIVSLSAQPEVQMVEAYGTIKASEVRDITIDFSAFIDQINVKNGQKVTKDENLMALNTEDFIAMIKEKEIDLKLLKKQNKDVDEMKEKLTILEDNFTLLKGKLERENIKDNHLVSNIQNGIVYNIDNVEGDMVFSGSRLMSIANLDSIIVDANIDQQFINWVAVGAAVDIIPEYDKSAVYKGKVSFISAKAFQNNGETFVPVEITMDAATEGLIIDADAQVKIYPMEER
jgi:multidrug resistance efflux pump